MEFSTPDIIKEAREQNVLFMLQQHEEKLKRADETHIAVKRIESALLGDQMVNPPVPGMISRLSDCEKWIAGCQERKKEARKERVDWGKWFFRAVAGIVVTYLAYKAGMLPGKSS
jgi:hypothetical protein